MSARSRRRGLLIVYTGNGKGKTTSALGVAFRALGYGWKICMVQFIKGTWKYGEMASIAELGDRFELHRMGAGFYKILDDVQPEAVHREAAAAAAALTVEKLQSEAYDLVIADELTVALGTGLVDAETVNRIVAARPQQVHLIITGRGAPDFLIESADLVTEMREVKHPFQKGLKAQPGIDY
ncbi:MAG: cob(I)yrinic acid a,c-diamide adenosyltransferase [Candidatus Marinimicrobia bacterium]|nr:cob(I)yrinic acid a,c-diamide adenosyltransferase [Candidatus Neomarinimicrobiota bacterium]